MRCVGLCCLTNSDYHIPWGGGVIHLWVFEVSNHRIACAIVVKFHYVTLIMESNRMIIY